MHLYFFSYIVSTDCDNDKTTSHNSLTICGIRVH